MSSKKRNLRSTQVPAEKTAPLVPHSEEPGAGWIEVVIRSESIRMVGNVALEESPALLGNTQDFAAKFPRIFAGRWVCGKILGLQHCYAFEMTPHCSDGIEVDLNQIVSDARRLLDRSIQKLEELARRGTVASRQSRAFRRDQAPAGACGNRRNGTPSVATRRRLNVPA
jgi:hypothetical protein